MTSGIRLPSLVVSILLHVVLGLLLVSNIQLLPHKPARAAPAVNIVQATTVDSQTVDAELERLHNIEKKKETDQKRREEELKSRLEDLQKKTAVVETKRKEEEKRLAALEQKKEEEQKAREVEEQKAVELKNQQDEEKKKKAEQEKKQKEDQKRKEAEDLLKKQMEQEEGEQAGQRLREKQKAINAYVARIRSLIERQFNRTGLPEGLSCTLFIRTIPGGEVISVRVEKSSGNPIFDRRAEDAVRKAAPLPAPDDPQLIEEARELRIQFTPDS